MWNLRRKEGCGGGDDAVKVLVRAKTHAIRSEKPARHRGYLQTFTLSSKLGESILHISSKCSFVP